MTFAKLTKIDGRFAWVNPATVAAVAELSSGSEVSLNLRSLGKVIEVTETPEQVLAKLEASAS